MSGVSDASGDFDHDHRRDDDDEQSNSDASEHSDMESNSDDESDMESGNQLLDLEAEESGASDSQSESGSSMDGYGDGFFNREESPPRDELHFFPQFMRLPLELRQHIWELFCPDITAAGRVYEFELGMCPNRAGYCALYPIRFDEQAAAPRALLATNRESRQFALRSFPDTLPTEIGGLPFNKERDIIKLGFFHEGVASMDPRQLKNIRNIAFSLPERRPRDYRHVCSMIKMYPSIKHIYVDVEFGLEYDSFTATKKCLGWCALETHHHFFFDTIELQQGLATYLEFVYCWPNLVRHPEFPKYWRETRPNSWPGVRLLSLLENDPDCRELIGDDTVLPLVSFSDNADFQNFLNKAETGHLDDSSDSDDHDGEEEPDEYESEGIDDSDIEEDSHSEDEDDLVVLGSDHDNEEDHSQDGQNDAAESEFGGFSPIYQGPTGQNTAVIDLTGLEVGAANFSSPEPEAGSSTASESGPDGEEIERRPRGALKRLRRTVVDSDDDDEENAESEDEDDAPRRKRARVAERNMTIILSSDDEEEDVAKMRRNNRARAVVLDDDDEDDDEEVQTASHRRKTVSGDDSSSDDEEDEEEEERGARPLTLTERLQVNRVTRRIGESSDEDKGREESDIEEMGGDDYDARDYADFQDDEEGYGDEDQGDGLIMGMAEEGDEDDDEDEGYYQSSC
ncbi:hypothetical protein B0H66DRAFT_377865 [Apodospora peruviana]|uniref:2EXR domain-containing protein n=1 Tax=Apodospora peruviana TaxID=516989 RepID=A0AAE0LYJ6_9PEZI|nr:hypothetical protein B0H66DRAFT_377865 [Apodospora peruviana]